MIVKQSNKQEETKIVMFFGIVSDLYDLQPTLPFRFVMGYPKQGNSVGIYNFTHSMYKHKTKETYIKDVRVQVFSPYYVNVCTRNEKKVS